MKVVKFVSGFLDTNTYLLEEDRHLLIIDPADHTVVLGKCRNVASVTVLLTHEHFDHISGLNRIRVLCAASCVVIASKICSLTVRWRITWGNCIPCLSICTPLIKCGAW